MNGLETILAAHALKPYDPACSCGWDWDSSKCILPNAVDFDSSRFRMSDTVRPEQHRAHVADRIRAWLLADDVIEQAAAEFTRPEHGCDGTDAGCYEAGCPFPLHTVASDTELARAAITAALDTNQGNT